MQQQISYDGITGAVPIIPTPFHANEEIDEEGLGQLVEFAASSGLSAICLPMEANSIS